MARTVLDLIPEKLLSYHPYRISNTLYCQICFDKDSFLCHSERNEVE